MRLLGFPWKLVFFLMLIFGGWRELMSEVVLHALLSAIESPVHATPGEHRPTEAHGGGQHHGSGCSDDSYRCKAADRDRERFDDADDPAAEALREGARASQ